jgi:ferrous iron transport protein A
MDAIENNFHFGEGMTLDALPVGHVARVVQVHGSGAHRRRLLELGMVAGTPIRRTGAAPLGEPLTFELRGAVLALRRSEACQIDVEPEEAR